MLRHHSLGLPTGWARGSFLHEESLYCWVKSAQGCISHVWTQGLLLDMGTCHDFTCPPRFWNSLCPQGDAEEALMKMVSGLLEAPDSPFWSSCPFEDNESRSILWPLGYLGEETQYGQSLWG